MKRPARTSKESSRAAAVIARRPSDGGAGGDERPAGAHPGISRRRVSMATHLRSYGDSLHEAGAVSSASTPRRAGRARPRTDLVRPSMESRPSGSRPATRSTMRRMPWNSTRKRSVGRSNRRSKRSRCGIRVKPRRTTPVLGMSRPSSSPCSDHRSRSTTPASRSADKPAMSSAVHVTNWPPRVSAQPMSWDERATARRSGAGSMMLSMS